MLNSIFIGMTGLQGYSQGLRVIANNTANINTPGYKSSSLQFADMFYSSANTGSGTMQVGYGLNTAGTVLNFQQGELRQTGNSLDLAIDGQGLFTVRDSGGNTHYTRAGQFTFNTDGVLVSRIDQSKVMGQDANGAIGEISISGKSMIAGKATTTVRFAGHIAPGPTPHTIPNVKVFDSLGGEHVLSVRLTDDSATLAGQWKVELLKEDGSVADTKFVVFANGSPTAASSILSMSHVHAGLPTTTFNLDFSKDVFAFGSGASNLGMTTQDGFGSGSLTSASFDATGTLVMNYSNGQVVKGSRLSMGRFDSLDAVAPNGNNPFDATNQLAWHTGLGGEGGFGSVRSGMIELSNVDLSQEFSDLVIMQRGYQASSQVISTANDMLQELFQMKSK
jgi:flagellar hook protein FlgE